MTSQLAGVPRPSSLAPRPCFLILLLLLLGCSRSAEGDYDRKKKAEQKSVDTLEAQGAKARRVSFPQGEAWAVDLSGMTISDDQIRQMKQLGKICELNLSRSSVTDAQLGLINELGLGVLLLNLDLSNTSVTDAGFEKLSNLKLLSTMNLTGTKVTPEAVERFRANRQDDAQIMDLFRNPRIQM